jgi:hypothetical protein
MAVVTVVALKPVLAATPAGRTSTVLAQIQLGATTLRRSLRVSRLGTLGLTQI